MIEMRFSCALAFTFACLSGCLSRLEPDVGEAIVTDCKPEDSEPEEDVSFAKDVLPLFQEGCGCHNPARMGFAVEQTGFSVESFASVMNGGVNSPNDIVVEGDPCASVLVQKLSEAPPYGSRMPLYGPYFTREDRALLHDWIAEGARDN